MRQTMVSVVEIASYICERYKKEYGERIDEMKLHKLLYFMQKECIVQTDDPMFPETLYARKYGPVMPAIRQLYKQDRLHYLPSSEVVSQYRPVFDEVFRRLAGSKPLTLVSISHGEESWKRARIGFGKYESSDVPMKLEDIREDAERYKERVAKLRLLKGFLDSKGITDYEGFLRSVARTTFPASTYLIHLSNLQKIFSKLENIGFQVAKNDKKNDKKHHHLLFFCNFVFLFDKYFVILQPIFARRVDFGVDDAADSQDIFAQILSPISISKENQRAKAM